MPNSRPPVIHDYEYFTHSQTPTDDIWIFDFGCSSGTKITPSLDIYTLIYVSSGEVSVKMNLSEYRLRSRDLFLVPAGVKAQFYGATGNIRFYWISFAGKRASALLASASFSFENPQYSALDNTEVAGLFVSLMHLGYSNDPAVEIHAVAALYKLFAVISSAHTRTAELPASGKCVIQIENIIYERYQDPNFRIADIAGLTHFSKSYICEISQKYKGITVEQFLIQYRLRKASALLLYTNDTVQSVGLSVGYPNTIHFSKIFAKYYHMTPTEYRQKAGL